MYHVKYDHVRKLRVLYVDDTDARSEEEIRQYEQGAIDAFWNDASTFCRDHRASATRGGENCPFELKFFSHFPPALVAGLRFIADKLRESLNVSMPFDQICGQDMPLIIDFRQL